MREFIDYDLWGWTPHPEVWVIVLVALAVGGYVTRVLAPAAGEVIERRRKGCYLAAVGALWLASGWPMHDISEEYLYSVHMVQHLLITLVVPPLLLLATPEWIARRVVDPSRPLARRLLRPITVGVTFNVVVAITHIPWVVNTSAANGVFHYTVHLVLFVTAIAMWLPVCGPFEELRLQPLPKMFYLFAMSVLPTVPAGFLTFAQTPIYAAYDTPLRLWGVTVANDQQMAGLIMKIAGGLYLWTIIAGVFFRWSARQRAADLAGIALAPGSADGDGDIPQPVPGHRRGAHLHAGGGGLSSRRASRPASTAPDVIAPGAPRPCVAVGAFPDGSGRCPGTVLWCSTSACCAMRWSVSAPASPRVATTPRRWPRRSISMCGAGTCWRAATNCATR